MVLQTSKYGVVIYTLLALAQHAYNKRGPGKSQKAYTEFENKESAVDPKDSRKGFCMLYGICKVMRHQSSGVGLGTDGKAMIIHSQHPCHSFALALIMRANQLDLSASLPNNSRLLCKIAI